MPRQNYIFKEGHSLLQVGSMVAARSNNCFHGAGERGVCYQYFHIKDQAWYGVIFERGGYEHFSAENASSSLYISGEVCPAVADYRFGRVSQLVEDYHAGRFAVALRMTHGKE